MDEGDSRSEELSSGERSDDGENESEEGEETKESLENMMVQTIKEFSTYTRAITKDLEDNENTEIKQIEDAKKKGMKVKSIKPIWKDSTFKIDFISGLLNVMLSPERIIKYYITYVWPMKKHLKTRNTDFFLKNKRIYPGASEDDVQFFKALWSVKGAMTDKEKATVWKFWDTLIDITEAWQDIVHWERTEDDDLWIIDIDYNKAEENIHKEEHEISEDEEQIEKDRQYMQGNFDRYHQEVAKSNSSNNIKGNNSKTINNNNTKAAVSKEKIINAKKTNGRRKQQSSDDDSD